MKYELLQESVTNHLYGSADVYMSEGATLDINAKFKKMRAEYKSCMSELKKAINAKDADKATKLISDARKIIDDYESAIDGIEDSIGSVIGGAFFQGICQDLKAMALGIPTGGIGAAVSYIKDYVDRIIGFAKMLKDEDLKPSLEMFNARRQKVKGLINQYKKTIDLYEKKMLAELKEQKEDEVKESAALKLEIFESCHSGEITEEERDTLLEMIG